MTRKDAGFTLIELLTVLAIAAITLTIGFPAFSQMLQRQQVGTTMHLLRSDMAMARNTAVMKQARVIVCPTDASGHCTEDQDWSGGWMVFSDADDNGRPDDAGDILRITDPPAGDRLQLPSSRPLLRYQSDGRAAGTNLTVYVCAEAGYAGKVVVNNLGRVRGERVRKAGTACPR